MLYIGKKYSAISQIYLILFILLSFLSSACIGKRSYYSEYKTAFIVIFLLDIIGIISWFFVMLCHIHAEEETQEDSICKSFSYRGEIITLVFVFTSRVIQLGDMPRWDSLTYYSYLSTACENFDFTFSQFWDGFALVSHPTRGYALLLAIGEFLMGGKYIGVILANLVLALISSVCMYRILEKIILKCTWVYYTLATCVMFSASMFLGTFSYFHPDAGVTYAFIFVLYNYLYKKNILLIASMLLLVQTKEVGILVLGGFVGGLFLFQIFRGKEKKIYSRAFSFFKQPIGVMSVLGGMAGAIYLCVRIKTGFSFWSYGKEISPYMSSVHFIPEFIIFRLKQYFILNFGWLTWGSVAILLVIAAIKDKKQRKKSFTTVQRKIVFSVLCAVIIFMIFYCIYITFLLPRYQIILEFCAIFILALLLRKVIKNKRIRYLWIGGIGICVFLQSYVTIDPLSLAVFQHKDTGNGTIIADNVNNKDIQRDYTVYNHQFNYLDKAYDSILRNVGYHEGMDIWIWNNDTNSQIWPQGFYWDMNEGKRTMIQSESTIEMRGLAYQDEEISMNLMLNPEAVFILIPQMGINEEYAEKFLNDYYEIRYKGYVTIPLGGKVSFYVCDLIGERVIQK